MVVLDHNGDVVVARPAQKARDIPLKVTVAKEKEVTALKGRQCVVHVHDVLTMDWLEEMNYIPPDINTEDDVRAQTNKKPPIVHMHTTPRVCHMNPMLTKKNTSCLFSLGPFCLFCIPFYIIIINLF